MNFSVLMSVYKNEKSEHFLQAIDSVVNNSVKPNEIILIRDGVVGDELQSSIDLVIAKYGDLLSYYPFDENHGLGEALKFGVEHSKNEIIARMDTDDICLPDRFEKQIKVFKDDPDIDLVGGIIAEFINTPDKTISYRCLPQEDKEIKAYIKKRNPFNHMTVMFKKSAVLKAGNYEHFYLFEDWFLWIRMFLSGCKFKNLSDTLVYARISGMAERRGGYKYFKSFKNLLRYMKKNKIIGFFAYSKAIIIRFFGYVICPTKLREKLYKKYLRKVSNEQ